MDAQARASPRCASEATHESAWKCRRREGQRLPSPRLRALRPFLLAVDQREQPEASDVGVGDVRRVGSLGRLNRHPARLVELAGEKQCLRQARQGACPQNIRGLLSRRDRAPTAPDGRAHVAALDHVRTDDLHAGLEVRHPKLRPLPPSPLRDRQITLNLDIRRREHRRGRRRRYRQDGMLHEQLGGKPAQPTEELPEPAAPNELEMPLDRRPPSRPSHPGRRGTTARDLRSPHRAARRPSPDAPTTAPGRRRPNRA